MSTHAPNMCEPMLVMCELCADTGSGLVPHRTTGCQDGRQSVPQERRHELWDRRDARVIDRSVIRCDGDGDGSCVLINTLLHNSGAVYGTFDAFRFKVQSGLLATVLPSLSGLCRMGCMLAASVVRLCRLHAISQCLCRLHAISQYLHH